MGILHSTWWFEWDLHGGNQYCKHGDLHGVLKGMFMEFSENGGNGGLNGILKGNIQRISTSLLEFNRARSGSHGPCGALIFRLKMGIVNSFVKVPEGKWQHWKLATKIISRIQPMSRAPSANHQHFEMHLLHVWRKGKISRKQKRSTFNNLRGEREENPTLIICMQERYCRGPLGLPHDLDVSKMRMWTP